MTDKRLSESIDYALANAHAPAKRASLFVFEDLSQTTHRVNLDSMFGEENWILVSKSNALIPSNRSPDILTKGSFSRGGYS